MPSTDINKIIVKRFEDLSPRLKQAARFVMQHPEDVALMSMRSLAAAARVPPTSMLRLARELDYENYEAFRESYRKWMRTSRNPLSDRMLTLRERSSRNVASAVIDETTQREITNIGQTISEIGSERLVRAQRVLSAAKRIYVLGLRSLYAPAFYFHYMSRTFTHKTVLLDGGGGTLLDDIRNIERRDALLVFSINPYARDIVRAVEFARAQDVPIIAITDSPVSPAGKYATLVLQVLNKGESMALTSVLPALAVAQVLLTLLIAHSGEDSVAAIAASNRQLLALDVFVREG